MFNIGDLVKHPIYFCYGIITQKYSSPCLDRSRYYITWADTVSFQSWERKEDLILVAKVNDE